MIKKLFITLVIALAIQEVSAQARFFSTVRIEFEKTTSIRQLMKDLQENNSWYEQNKDRYPVSSLDQYIFTGDSTKSLYQPGKETPIDPEHGIALLVIRILFIPIIKEEYPFLKTLFEETFLVEDSLQKIKWKITGDVRTIAGYDCRKAIGILNDSIAIFAFYTDELMINGGPEGIQGLPGMILGMGIPRLHATWFATKVEVFDVKMNKVVPATKGKKVSRTALMKRLESVSKDWGSYGSKLLINFVI